MKFAEWLIGEAVKIEVDPAVQQLPVILAGGNPYKFATPQELSEIALGGLRKYFSLVDPLGFSYLKERYHFKLSKAIENSDGLTLTIQFLPIDKGRGSEELVPQDDPLYDYHKKYNQGKTGRKVYKRPKDALEDIPSDTNFAYRGMSWEEWQSIQRTGYIFSRGAYNLGQEEYTLFGKEPRTALHYASGFAPLQYQPSMRKPSVVIAIPKNLTLTHKEDPENIPDTELGVKGKLSKNHIEHAWLITPHKINKNAYMELVFPYVPAWDDKKYKDPMTGFFKIDHNKVRPGSGNLSTVVSYSIRKLL